MHPMEKSSSSTSQQEQRSSQDQLLQQSQPPQSPSLQQQPLQTRHEDAADNISNFSRSSYNFGSTMSAPNPECESNSTPVSVRDMIKRYNSASKMDAAPHTTPLRRQSQYTLPSSRSSFFGINKFSAHSNGKREESDDDAVKPTRNYCRRCSSCKKYEQTGPRVITAPTPERLCSRKAVRCNSSGGESEGSCQICTGDSMRKRCSSCELTESKELPNPLKISASKERCPRSSVDSMEEVTCQPVEASYQSKTTIAKTSSGVRIIIDIFFDQDQNVAPSDVIGSRVETDIPQSRILSEFQQQSVQHQAARMQN